MGVGGIIWRLLITHVRRNMKPRAIALWDKIMLKKRFIIETVNDQLKNITQIEHSRHRSVSGFMLNLIGSLIAYCHKKTSRQSEWIHSLIYTIDLSYWLRLMGDR